AAIPVVILFYMLKRKRVVRLVSSTLLWQKFLAETQASAPFQRLRHNWLLILQLIMLTLAILALARPYFAGKVTGGRLQVVILDASASMQSTDESPSRFEKARGEAFKLVDSLRDTDQMVVLQAAAHTDVKQSATSEKSALRRALQSATVTDSTTRLNEALKMAESLTRDNNDAEVHLFSDGAAPGMKELENKGLRLVYHRVGQGANNLGIVSLDVRPNPENPDQRAIFSSVANFFPDEQKTEVELLFDGQLIEAKALTIPPTNTTPVVFLAAQPHDGVFTVRLTAKDDLKADNQASIVSMLPLPVKVLLVTQGNRFLEKALKSAGKVELAMASSLTEEKPDFDLVVLDDVVPAVWPSVNVLAIRTMNTNWFEPAGEVEGPPIVDWRATHPLSRFVTFENVQIAKALIVKTPSWAVAVVDSPQTPLVLAGELARQRIVWLAFDTVESTWPLRISFPIFIANVVDWLNPAAVHARQLTIPAGAPFRNALNGLITSAQVTLPDGSAKELAVDPTAREVVFGETEKAGIYRLTAGTNQIVFAANLLDAAESDTRPREELDFGKFGSVTATTLKRANLELWRWIAAAGLAVLLFEWWWYHKRTA
ncbi:MAG TPA: BatA and WFA domain-containing protein, partial [Verrucomicrobiae bacterium]|nr:BatA and WFA domain-containing protein [Verrucomicrobiae bacterium]